QGDRVLIWGVNRPEYGIAFLAALRLGAILVPLEANYAAEFAEKIAARTRASAAIVSAQTLARAKTLGLPLHEMERLPDLARDGASVTYPTSRPPAVVRRTFKERKVSMVLITPAVVKSLMLAIERSAEAQGKKELFEKLRRVARRLPMSLRRLVFFSVHRQFG